MINTGPAVISPRYLSEDERLVIADLYRQGRTLRAIAGELNRSPSTIGRELRRNRDPDKGQYRPFVAHRLAGQRRARPGRGKLLADAELRGFVTARLAKRWSPEQISHALRTAFPDQRERHLAPETIYQAVYRTELGGLQRELPKALRTGRRRRKPHPHPQARRPGRLGNMTMIEQRPAEADDRAIPGHWEGDLITGESNRSAIGTLVERSSHFTILLHLPGGRHTAEAVRDALVAAMSVLPAHLRRSLTWDQGSEMALHAEIAGDLAMPVYFCEKTSPGSGRRMRTPTACCATTSRKAPTFPCPPPRTSPRSPPSSTSGPARRSTGPAPPTGSTRSPAARPLSNRSPVGEDGRMADLRRRHPEPPAGAPRVEFKPGLAEETLRELAPLLAEEGIDVDHIEVADLETLQRALDRAVERRNLDLFSPLGATRQIAAAHLRRVVEAILTDDTRRAGELLDHVQPESPDNSVATVASCIGIALGLLDDWLGPQPGGTRTGAHLALPAGHWNGERAATDILALARKGKAFRSLDKLLIRQGGPQVLAGSTLALAAAVTTHPQHGDTPDRNPLQALIR